jgi:hypothetical protein
MDTLLIHGLKIDYMQGFVSKVIHDFILNEPGLLRDSEAGPRVRRKLSDLWLIEKKLYV